MPPKPKFSKEEIVEAALQITSENGVEALTANSLREKLNCSASPIFTVFSGMEEVQSAMVDAAKAIYKGYVHKGLAQDIPFRGVGEQYVQFAMDEPKLFQLLFMGENRSAQSISTALPMLDDSYMQILSSVTAYYSLTEEQAKRLYQHLFIYTHGIACLCATKTCCFSAQEIENMMSEIFLSLLKNAAQLEKSEDIGMINKRFIGYLP